jgi:hypothetical protein
MSTMLTAMQEWQDEFFELVDRLEEPVVKVAGEIAESVADYVPQRPAWPFVEQLPTVSELVEFQVAFTTRFVDQQAAFVRSVMKAVQPTLAKVEAMPVAEPKTRKAATPKVA